MKKYAGRVEITCGRNQSHWFNNKVSAELYIKQTIKELKAKGYTITDHYILSEECIEPITATLTD